MSCKNNYKKNAIFVTLGFLFELTFCSNKSIQTKFIQVIHFIEIVLFELDLFLYFT